MSRITPISAKKRKLEEATSGKTSKPRKRIRKQRNYHSSSSDDEQNSDTGFAPVNLNDSDQDTPLPTRQKTSNTTSAKHVSKKNKKQTTHEDEEPLQVSNNDEDEDETQAADPTPASTKPPSGPASESASDLEDQEAATDDESESDTQSLKANHKPKSKSKRNDPEAFSTSMSKILSTKLPTSSRADPVLSRSLAASQSRNEASAQRLENKAKTRMRAEKVAALQKGRTVDVLGIERGITGEVAEKEKQFRKIAQRGVIQLFNAFRAAHVRAEEARREERKKGTIGMGERERKINEVSKEGFLELIGGKKKAAEVV